MAIVASGRTEAFHFCNIMQYNDLWITIACFRKRKLSFLQTLIQRIVAGLNRLLNWTPSCSIVRGRDGRASAEQGMIQRQNRNADRIPCPRSSR